jgi:SAM-dependent methyltransferase
MTEADPRQRFSARVDDYVRYRPRYPDAVLDLFRGELGLTAGSVLADVGSGTGISAEPFLRAGNVVYCVEPNAEMRAAAERSLGHYPGFRSVNGSAEATTLSDRSVDFILCAQAFHWFDRARAKAEFSRIARPGAWVVLMWNDRRKGGTALLEGYEALLHRFGTDYRKVDHTNTTAADIAAFLGAPARTFTLPNAQHLDFDALKGRVFSSSYTPLPGQAGYDELVAGVRELFDRTQAGGQVTIDYDTRVYAGRPA